MANHRAFTRIEPDLLGVFDEIRRREPIFHTAEFGFSIAELERALAPEYWEVGASGRRYSRDFVLRSLADRPAADAATSGWRTYDCALRRLGPETYLFTYTLLQGERRTRRATVWERFPAGWRILYHQGTIVSVEEDDVAPV